MTVTDIARPVVELSPRAKLEILGATLLALFLFALDQTVVGTALPNIVSDLKGNERARPSRATTSCLCSRA